jgi:hypothetical protein
MTDINSLVNIYYYKNNKKYSKDFIIRNIYYFQNNNLLYVKYKYKYLKLKKQLL